MVSCLVVYLRAAAVMFSRGADAAQLGSSSSHHLCDAAFISMQKVVDESTQISKAREVRQVWQGQSP